MYAFAVQASSGRLRRSETDRRRSFSSQPISTEQPLNLNSRAGKFSESQYSRTLADIRQSHQPRETAPLMKTKRKCQLCRTLCDWCERREGGSYGPATAGSCRHMPAAIRCFLAAEQRRRVAWGESNERQRGWCNPRLRITRKALPAALLAATPPEEQRGNMVLHALPGVTVCSLEARNPHPRLASSTAPQLSFVVTNHNTAAYCDHRTLQMTLCSEAPKQGRDPCPGSLTYAVCPGQVLACADRTRQFTMVEVLALQVAFFLAAQRTVRRPSNEFVTSQHAPVGKIAPARTCRDV